MNRFKFERIKSEITNNEVNEKSFSELSDEEKMELKEKDPYEYTRLLDEQTKIDDEKNRKILKKLEEEPAETFNIPSEKSAEFLNDDNTGEFEKYRKIAEELKEKRGQNKQFKKAKLGIIRKKKYYNYKGGVERILNKDLER